MNQMNLTPLWAWQNFYVIVGSAAGALTGLQFVVVTLLAQAAIASSEREMRAFGTPTVSHFWAALVISAMAAAPWHSLASFGVCLGVLGALGVVFSVNTIWHARKASYNPDFEDWVWYTGLPLVAHTTLVAAASMLWWNVEWALCIIAVDSLTFLLLGIRNSWDTVTYMALNHSRNSRSTPEER